MFHLILWGLVAHIIADWFLQNEWMAKFKTDLRHPAAWLHSGLHFLCLLFVFPFLYAFALFLLHLIVDTRRPLQFWRRLLKQGPLEGPVFISFAMWQDQMLHVLCIVFAARLLTGGIR